MKTQRSNEFRRAFTLIEVMIAITLLSLVMIAIYSSWAAVIRATKIGETYAAEAQRSRVAIKAVEDALTGAVMYGENIRYYSFETASEGDFAGLAFTAHLSSTFPGSGLFGDQSIRRVTFTVEPDQDRKNQLVMTQVPMLLATNETMTPYPIVLAKDVSLFVLEFWDVQKSDWAEQFIVTNQLPKMMRVTIGVGHLPNSNDPEEVVSRVIALPGTVIMGDVQRPILPNMGNANAPPPQQNQGP